MSEILPRVLLPQEGNSALCLKASGSNSFAGFNRAIRADDLWAPREQLTPGRARFHSALCGPNPHENSFHLILIPSDPALLPDRRCDGRRHVAGDGRWWRPRHRSCRALIPPIAILRLRPSPTCPIAFCSVALILCVLKQG